MRGIGHQRPARVAGSTHPTLLSAFAATVCLALLITAVGTATAAFTGATSNPANALTSTSLAAPSGLSVTQTCSGGSINAALTWTPTASTWADGYTWERTTGGTTSAATAVAGRSAAATTDGTALAAATTYQYQLTATANLWRSSVAVASLTTTSCQQVAVADITSSATVAAALTISVPVPATTASGDLLVVFVSGAATTAVTPDQAGWTAIRTDQSHNTWITQGLWYRRATAAEPASYGFTRSNPKADMVGGMLRVTGANATTPINASAGNGQGSTVSTTIVAPSVTTTVPGTLLVTFASTTDDNTYTPAAGMTERVDYTTGQWMSEQIATQPIAAAGATGTRTITINDLGNVYAAAQTIAIGP